MRFDLSLDALVNAGGAFVWFVVGLGILAVGGRERRARLLGWVAVTFGATYVVENLLVNDGTVPGPALLAIVSIAATAAVLRCAGDFVADVPRRARQAVATVAAAVGLVMLPVVALALRVGYFDGLALEGIATICLLAEQVSLVVLIAALGAAYRAAPDARERHHAAFLALAFAPFAAFLHLYLWTIRLPGADPPGLLAYGAGGVGVALVMVAFGARHPGEAGGAGRAVVPAVAAAGLLGIAVATAGRGNFGLFGVARTVGVAFLALAIVRHDLLGVELPRLAVKRGALATGALATLLIVAQVAQNFFSAQYGLLTGGIVAGAFLFAATPIQRALERGFTPAAAGWRGDTGGAPEGARAARSAEIERAYKVALRRMHADGRVTEEEEVALSHLADELGITARRATEMRHEIERERRAR